MSAILKIDFQGKQLHFFTYIFACENYIFPKQGQTRTSSGTITVLLNCWLYKQIRWQIKCVNVEGSSGLLTPQAVWGLGNEFIAYFCLPLF